MTVRFFSDDFMTGTDESLAVYGGYVDNEDRGDWEVVAADNAARVTLNLPKFAGPTDVPVTLTQEVRIRGTLGGTEFHHRIGAMCRWNGLPYDDANVRAYRIMVRGGTDYVVSRHFDNSVTWLERGGNVVHALPQSVAAGEEFGLAMLTRPSGGNVELQAYIDTGAGWEALGAPFVDSSAEKITTVGHVGMFAQRSVSRITSLEGRDEGRGVLTEDPFDNIAAGNTQALADRTDPVSWAGILTNWTVVGDLNKLRRDFNNNVISIDVEDLGQGYVGELIGIEFPDNVGGDHVGVIVRSNKGDWGTTITCYELQVRVTGEWFLYRRVNGGFSILESDSGSPLSITWESVLGIQLKTIENGAGNIVIDAWVSIDGGTFNQIITGLVDDNAARIIDTGTVGIHANRSGQLFDRLRAYQEDPTEITINSVTPSTIRDTNSFTLGGTFPNTVTSVTIDGDSQTISAQDGTSVTCTFALAEIRYGNHTIIADDGTTTDTIQCFIDSVSGIDWTTVDRMPQPSGQLSTFDGSTDTEFGGSRDVLDGMQVEWKYPTSLGDDVDVYFDGVPEVFADSGSHLLDVRVHDGDIRGPWAAYTVTSDLPNPPVADAGADQTLIHLSTVTLDASGSTAPGGFSDPGFTWTHVSGPNEPEIASSESASASFDATAVGTYVLQVQVFDQYGQSDTDQVTITSEAVSGPISSPLPAIIQDGAGALSTLGAADQPLPALAQSADGEVASITSGAAAQTLPSLTQSAAGELTVFGDAAQTMPAIIQSADGTVAAAPEGEAAQTLPALAQDASGALTDSGEAAQSLPTLTQSATGGADLQSVSGAVEQTLPGLSQSASGSSQTALDHIENAEDDLQLAKDDLGAGTAEATGGASQSLQALSQAAEATVQINAFSGGIAQALPAVSQQATGEKKQAGSAAQILPALNQQAAGAATLSGEAEQALPAFDQQASGSIDGQVAGVASQSLQAVTQQAEGNLPGLQPPTDLQTTDITGTSAQANWTPVGVGVTHDVRWRRQALQELTGSEDHLVGLWPMDAADHAFGTQPTEITDRTGANDGTGQGVVAVVEDNTAGLQFDGSEQTYVDVGVDPTGVPRGAVGEVLLLDVRIKLNQDPPTGFEYPIVSYMDNWELRVSSDQELYFRVFGANNGGPSPLLDLRQQITAISVVWEVGDSIRTYVNGELLQVHFTSVDSDVAGRQLNLGKRAEAVADVIEYNGFMSRVRIWDVAALTLSEIEDKIESYAADRFYVQDGVAGDSYIIDELSAGVDYQWRVRSDDGVEVSRYSDPELFTTALSTGAVVQTLPAFVQSLEGRALKDVTGEAASILASFIQSLSVPPPIGVVPQAEPVSFSEGRPYKRRHHRPIVLVDEVTGQQWVIRRVSGEPALVPYTNPNRWVERYPPYSGPAVVGQDDRLYWIGARNGAITIRIAPFHVRTRPVYFSDVNEPKADANFYELVLVG